VIIIAVIVIGSILLGENLFLELSWTARILLIGLAVGFLFSGKHEHIPTPSELQFYDDCLILYSPKKSYSKNVCKKEIFKLWRWWRSLFDHFIILFFGYAQNNQLPYLFCTGVVKLLYLIYSFIAPEEECHCTGTRVTADGCAN
jgi:hypothetical protein